MLIVLALLLVVWLVLIVIGFAVKTLFWLAIIGIVLFVVSVIAGAAHHLLKNR